MTDYVNTIKIAANAGKSVVVVHLEMTKQT